MALLKAKADMSRGQLIERCEDEYVPFISRTLPIVQNHRRHYVTDERSPALVAAGSPFVETGLDMISEWTFSDNGGEAEIVKALANADTRAAIGKFEAEIFDAAHVKKFAVETANAPPVPLARVPPVSTDRQRSERSCYYRRIPPCRAANSSTRARFSI